jgi:MarR family transcriptional regulator, organic hydroperoxide resistance regulator
MLLESLNKTCNYFIKFVESDLEKYNIKGLSFSHYEIIRLVHRHKKLQFKDISNLILKHKSTTTALVEKLKSLNYIDVLKSKQDKRKSFVILGSKGKEIINIIKTIEQKTDLVFQKALTPKEQSNISQQLKKITNQ